MAAVSHLETQDGIWLTFPGFTSHRLPANMPIQLRRIKPRSRQQRPTVTHEPTGQVKGQSIRVDSGTTTPTQRATANREVARLKQIGGSLQELIHLAEANRSLPRTAHGHRPARTAIRLETRKLLNQIASLLGERNSEQHPAANVAGRQEAAKHRRQVESSNGDGRRLVKLKISADIVRLLEAFRKTGHDPGRLVEQSLWSNSEIRDAAAIIGIRANDAA